MHHVITGHDFTMPNSMQYDHVTRNLKEFNRQVEVATTAILDKKILYQIEERELFLEQDFNVQDIATVQLSGHIDLVLSNAPHISRKNDEPLSTSRPDSDHQNMPGCSSHSTRYYGNNLDDKTRNQSKTSGSGLSKGAQMKSNPPIVQPRI